MRVKMRWTWWNRVDAFFSFAQAVGVAVFVCLAIFTHDGWTRAIGCVGAVSCALSFYAGFKATCEIAFQRGQAAELERCIEEHRGIALSLATALPGRTEMRS
jgi:hypothetical protein